MQLITLSPLGLHNPCQNIHYTSKNSIQSSRQRGGCSGAVHGEKGEKKGRKSFRNMERMKKQVFCYVRCKVVYNACDYF